MTPAEREALKQLRSDWELTISGCTIVRLIELERMDAAEKRELYLRDVCGWRAS